MEYEQNYRKSLKHMKKISRPNKKIENDIKINMEISCDFDHSNEEEIRKLVKRYSWTENAVEGSSEISEFRTNKSEITRKTDILQVINKLSGEISQLSLMVTLANERIRVKENENFRLKENIAYLKMIHSRNEALKCSCIIQ